MPRERIEWAVVWWDFREIVVASEGLKTMEEAEAWRAARQITEDLAAGEALYRSDAIVQPRKFRVMWRKIDEWHSPEEIGLQEAT